MILSGKKSFFRTEKYSIFNRHLKTIKLYLQAAINNQKSPRSKNKLSFHCPFSQQSGMTTQTKEIQESMKYVLGEINFPEQTILIK